MASEPVIAGMMVVMPIRTVRMTVVFLQAI